MYNIESKSNKQYYLAGYSLTKRIMFSGVLRTNVYYASLTLLHTGTQNIPMVPGLLIKLVAGSCSLTKIWVSSRMTYQKDQGPGLQTRLDQIHLDRNRRARNTQTDTVYLVRKIKPGLKC